MADIVDRRVSDQRVLAGLLGGLATLALSLACVGLYGVMSFAVTQRTHEIGVRLALGAGSRDVAWLVVRRCLVLSVVGILIGALLSAPASFALASQLYGVGGADPTTFIGVTLLLLVVALCAGYLPARRATKVDPMVALRYE
jgi:ABC-type antimicrobial peptide transport system permease subunit